jgi:hypothetical protein
LKEKKLLNAKKTSNIQFHLVKLTHVNSDTFDMKKTARPVGSGIPEGNFSDDFQPIPDGKKNNSSEQIWTMSGRNTASMFQCFPAGSGGRNIRPGKL